MTGLVDISDFMNHLKANDLVIVSRKDLLHTTKVDLELMQVEMLKRKDLSAGDIVKAKLLPLSSDEGVRHWIKSGKIKETEVYYTKTKRLRIMTSAVKRLRNEI